jgi:hypothetical protein
VNNNINAIYMEIPKNEKCKLKINKNPQPVPYNWAMLPFLFGALDMGLDRVRKPMKRKE